MQRLDSAEELSFETLFYRLTSDDLAGLILNCKAFFHRFQLTELLKIRKKIMREVIIKLISSSFLSICRKSRDVKKIIMKAAVERSILEFIDTGLDDDHVDRS